MAASPTTITPYRNGPYLVRGDFEITDQQGRVIKPKTGVVALCRCGHSRTRPFCDGTHKLMGFEASGGEERASAQPGSAELRVVQSAR